MPRARTRPAVSLLGLVAAKMPSGGCEVTHDTQVLAVDADDAVPVLWDSDVSQAQLAHDVAMLLDEG